MAWGLWKSLASAVSWSIDLSDALEALLEFDDWRHRSLLGQLSVDHINNCISNFDLTVAINPRSQLEGRNADVSALGCREVGFVGKHGQNPKLV
jgi:hypothetical protein